MGMELTVQPLNLAAVVFNKAEMAAAVAAINERYAGLVVTDKAEAKKDRAEVNKLLKQIDEARKSIKRQYEAPLKAFEADIKEIVDPLKKSAAAIDEQIKRIEDDERTQRKAALEAVYDDLGSPVPLSRVWDESWVNASTSVKKATEALTSAIKAAEAEYAVIYARPNAAALIERYFRGATLAEVLAYADELDRIEAEQKQAAQTFAIQTPQEEPAPAEVVAELEAADPRNNYAETDIGVQVTAKTASHSITLTCSDSVFDRICAYMDSFGVFYIIED